MKKSVGIFITAILLGMVPATSFAQQSAWEGEDTPIEPIYTDRSLVIQNKGSKYCFTAKNDADGTVINKGNYNGTASNNYQRWIFEPVANNNGGDFEYYIIRSERHDYHIISLKDQSTSTGANIVISRGDGDTYEQWFLEYAEKGYYYIRSRHSELYLGVTGTSSLGSVVTQNFTGNDLQKWRFIPADASLEKDAPVAPTALEVEEQSGSLKLSWTASSSTDVVGYVVLRAEGANSTSWNVIGRMIDKTEFIDSDVKGGRSYRYKVKAIDYSRNQSEASDPVSVETTSVPSSLTDLIAQDRFGSWYANSKLKATQGIYILPTAEAWMSLCNKYKDIFGEEPSENVKQALTTEWFRHLTPAEADMMKAHSVAYYNDCEEGDVYVVDKVCEDMIPNMLKASADIDLENPNWDYTSGCSIDYVKCDASYGIDGNKYWKATSYSTSSKVGYDMPFTLLPNRLYNVSVTIAANTEDAGDTRPNRVRLYLYRNGKVTPQVITNPQPTEDQLDEIFVYGGQKTETFTFQLDTHDEANIADVLQLASQVLAKDRNYYSNVLRIAKISISPVVEDDVPGDVDMDGTLDNDDVQMVATAVVLGEETSGNESEEKPSTDFTGDGKTLIDDIVALVNFTQTGQFRPSSAKERARYAAAAVPEFTTEKNLSLTTGENTTMSVDMSGVADYTATSFDIKVPEGVRVAIDENGKPIVALGNATATTHNLKAAMQEDGKTISVACYADDNACFNKTGESIITVALTTDDDMALDENAQISLANCMVTKPNLSSVMLDDYFINTGNTTGVEELETTDMESVPFTYYTLDGIQLSAPQKGFNLIKMSDGQVKKVWVK